MGNTQITTWASEKLSNDHFYLHLTKKIVSDLEQFYSQENKEYLLKQLIEKMIKGSREHGTPNNEDEIKLEIEQEMLDLVGWNLVKMWVREMN